MYPAGGLPAGYATHTGRVLGVGRDVIDGIADSLDALSVLIGNRDTEFILDVENDLGELQGMDAQLGQVGFQRDIHGVRRSVRLDLGDDACGKSFSHAVVPPAVAGCHLSGLRGQQQPPA